MSVRSRVLPVAHSAPRATADMSCVTNLAGGITLARGLRVRQRALSTRVGARAESPSIACRLSVSRASGHGPIVSVSRVGSARPARALVVRAADADAAPEPAAPAPAPAPPAKKKRPFIPALDSTRFFLISYITVGHFIACCTKDAFALKLLSQVNVVVGAFFVLSGYVVAYTCTELGEYKASPRIKPAPKFVASRIMGFYPLYLLAQLAFGWVFVYADNLYNGPIATAWHALITFTLTQAWFPAHAELWNAPTWFLSALAFATAVLPFALSSVASWRNAASRSPWLPSPPSPSSPKIAYSYDTAGWFFMEGMMGPKTHPNWLLFNATRFSPFMALVEILIGCVACRMIMVKECDPAEDPEGAKDSRAGILLGGAPGTLAASPAVPLIGMAGGYLLARRRLALAQRPAHPRRALHPAVHRLRHARASADGVFGSSQGGRARTQVVQHHARREVVDVPRGHLVPHLHPARTHRADLLQARGGVQSSSTGR